MDDLVQYLWFKEFVLPTIVTSVILLGAVIMICVAYIGKFITQKRRERK